jgi:hypothetical protein
MRDRPGSRPRGEIGRVIDPALADGSAGAFIASLGAYPRYLGSPDIRAREHIKAASSRSTATIAEMRKNSSFRLNSPSHILSWTRKPSFGRNKRGLLKQIITMH